MRSTYKSTSILYILYIFVYMHMYIYVCVCVRMHIYTKGIRMYRGMEVWKYGKVYDVKDKG